MIKYWGWKKVFCIFVLLVTLIVLLVPAAIAAAAPSGKNLEMSVKAGYDDAIRVGSRAPFYITLINKGDEFSGEAQVLIDTGYRAKMIYAVPFNLPKGSNKELVINVPVNTANRKVEVRIVSDGKTLKSLEYSFKKLISPETPVIGVLSEDKTGLRVLNGLLLSENLALRHPEEALKIQAMIAAGEKHVTPERPAEVIQLDESSLAVDVEAFSTFDYMIIADYDTTLLSEKQKEALEGWVERGNALILGTGPNGKKVYKGLKDSLKPFRLEGEKRVSISEELSRFVEKKAPESETIVLTGTSGEGTVVIGDRTNPLAVSYNKGDGKIIVLAFDPTLSPLSTWENISEMWRKLLAIAPVTVNEPANIVMGAHYSPYGGYYDSNGLVNQVPETQTPPFRVLFAIIAVYIVIAGPLLYILLKWKDKRDFNWVIIPVLAFLFMGIIYFAGFNTRYTTAVTNSFSVISLDTKNKKADIQTVIAAFNNRRSSMKIEYPNDSNIEVNQSRPDNYNYSSNPDDARNADIKGKVLMGDPIVYELYNIAMWEPTYLFGKKSENIQGNIISDINLSGGKLSLSIRNNTGFAFKESFISMGNNFINVGDVLPGNEKKVEIELDDPNIKKNYEEFINERYRNDYYHNRNNRPPDWLIFIHIIGLLLVIEL
ncbi:MAG: hypothetical protein ACOYWZ_14065 [Bacillota bacterium]